MSRSGMWPQIVTLGLTVGLMLGPANAQQPASARKPHRKSLLERNIRVELSFLASDAMQGRGSGTPYEKIAAEYIGSHFRQFGLEPGGDLDAKGDRSFVQRVPLESKSTWNTVGVLPGSDRRLASEAIVLSAHLDHLGVGTPVNGDAIFNGADDNASGCVAVMELARALAFGPRPKRTIYFVCFGSEETGGHGSRYFSSQSPVPLERIVANINFEMLGRADVKVKAGYLWLTGFGRSTLGQELARRGARLLEDPRPEQDFFRRSDNYNLALKGVVAHTVSSYGMHSDYHRPSDEVDKIDFPFMARAISSLISPIRWLANTSFRPSWAPGRAPLQELRRPTATLSLALPLLQNG